ncbi:MAG: DNA repair protein RadA [Thermicanus sp.]|nr:DNA repair protein RadA [Thermicanus sp.]
MGKTKNKFVCQQCGYESAKWMGRCPGCSEWNTMVEEREEKEEKRWLSNRMEKPIPFNEVKGETAPRIQVGFRELDRVLGGGIVPGSFTLVGGDPGIGKSTLLLQATHQFAREGRKVLYVSGEESPAQIRLRGERLGIKNENLFLMAETNVETMIEEAKKLKPTLVIIDSIQTMFLPEISSAPGSVSQVRETAAALLRFTKREEIATILVGHVTKQGEIAGPRILEHMVDTVLYFEGEAHHTYRILRAVKNRFGPTHEMGVFEMKEKGLVEVQNPSELFLSERSLAAAGASITATMEGTRPILVEIQALLSPTLFPTPRRVATGLDYNRVAMILAVLEKRAGILLGSQDAYVNVVGGMKLNDPAADLAIALSLVSSYRDRPIPSHDLLIGEVGLTGEIRGVPRVEQRIQEAFKMGIKRVILPRINLQGIEFPGEMKVSGVETLTEAIDEVLGR